MKDQNHRCETCQDVATVHIECVGIHLCNKCLKKIDARIVDINCRKVDGLPGAENSRELISASNLSVVFYEEFILTSKLNQEYVKALEEGLEQMKKLQPFQHRVLEEKLDLDGKRDALRAFIGGIDPYRSLSKAEQSRLNRQLEAMTLYSNILAERIAAFPK